ncbi:glycosyltransferase family 4 protein [Brachybacterium sp. Marseille-Q7125]|uniref:glycosyltransferase family 4 protein n=1 Tax=Brachybacterium sp. Marseille-Q7125 TaxID=2932815 RepID=UPI001FF33242|nr:glycosyltransferase family 4 protein [Brachybacterium sp. Marseille-Q7125]
MKIGLLTQWYAPEPGPAALPADLAQGLAARGHDVKVLTGFPNYPSGKLAEGWSMRRSRVAVEDGVTVHRVALYPHHGASGAKRLLNYGSFGASALVNGFRSLSDCDAVWVNYSPVTIGVPMLACRYLQRVPMMTHVLDLWPDTLTASGFLSGRPASVAEAVLNRWCAQMYRASGSVAYISPSVGDVLRSRGVPAEKLEYIPMWANERVFHTAGRSQRDALGFPASAVVLLYAGTMGGAQGLGSLIQAASSFSTGQLVVLMAGSGTHEDELRDLASELGADNVRFLGRRPPEQMPDLYATADLSYVSLNDHPLARMTMPSKIQASMASGCALLVAARGDARSVVLDSGAGFAADPEDDASIAAALREAIEAGKPELARRGRQARQYYTDTFSLDAAVSRVEQVLTATARTRGARS